MNVSVGEVPLELRAEVALQLIRHGEDPYLALAAAVWPPSATFEKPPTVNADGYCRNGHPWTKENTYIRKQGWRKCRVCERNRKRLVSSGTRKMRRKVPCAFCGKPATHPHDKGTGGIPTPRCRKCFMAQLKSGVLR